jgi:carboxyl-terminal processing protease
MGGLRSLGLGLLAVLALLGRAEAASADPRAAVGPVLRAGLAALAERHVDRLDLADLTLAGLRGLSLSDRRIVPALAGGMIELRADGRTLDRIPAPPRDAPSSWAEAAARLIAAATAASPVLARKPQEALLRAFFDEAVATLDPYTRYVPAEEARLGRMRRLGEAGLGLVLEPDPAGAVIVRVIDDGPAWAAGLVEGDRVVAIDGRPTARLPAEQLARLLEGEESAPVSLTVRRDGGRTETIVLARAMVAPETVTLGWQDGVPILRVSAFNRLTDRRLARTVIAVAHRDPAPPGLVLDLRGNRGGLLRQAIATADLFLTGGVIAVAEGRHPDASRTHRAGGADIAGGLRLAVLVDGASASSAEVLAAALQDNGRAVVVGSVTTGKGLIQTVVPLPDESELHVTWSSLVAPGGYAIQGLGVLPAVCTSRGVEVARAAVVRLHEGRRPDAEADWRATGGRVLPAAEAARLREACPAVEGSALDITAALWLLRGPDERARRSAPAQAVR